MAGNALQRGSGGSAKILPKPSRDAAADVRRKPQISKVKAQDVNANQKGSHDRQSQSKKIAIVVLALYVSFFERDVRVRGSWPVL